MPRLAILEGYSSPFGYRRSKWESRPARDGGPRHPSKAQKNAWKRIGRKMKKKRSPAKTKMRVCARAWKRGRYASKHKSYQSFMKKCLGGKIRVKKR